jgi:TIR domain-containing protein
VPYDVFISYKRGYRDALCDAIRKRIQEWGLRPFVDRFDLRPGESWVEQLNQVAESGPKVVLLLDESAAAKGSHVYGEVHAAMEKRLKIIPIKLDDTEQSVLGIPKQVQYADARDCKDDDSALGEIDRKLWIGLHDDPEVFTGLGRDADLWASRRLDDADGGNFWIKTSRSYLPTLSEIDMQWALVGPGGSGKSVLIALHVKEILNHPHHYPVILTPEVLGKGAEQICRLIGARRLEEIPEYLRRLRELHSTKVTLIIDSLDSQGSAEKLDELGDLLVLLSGCASIVVGCRPDVWETKFQQRLSFEVRKVDELSNDVVRTVLPQGSPLSGLPILKVPLFLSYALKHSAIADRNITTETRFLMNMWDMAANPSTTLRSSNKPALLRSLARLQLNANRFEVPLEQLRAEMASQVEFQMDLQEMAASGFLENTRTGQTERVRLRHDLLDGFNIAQLLNNPNDGRRLRQKLYADAHHGLGRYVLQSVVQAAHDSGSNDTLLREVFEALLDMLDRKWLPKLLGASAMANAWEATFVLKGKFNILSPFIIEVLKGAKVASLKDAFDSVEKIPKCTQLAQDGLSARVTQEAASSLASAFLDFKVGEAPNIPEAVPVLIANLDRWQFRGRFVEALAKYANPAAADAIEQLAEREWKKQKEDQDRDISEYIAQALGELSLLNRISSIRVLKRIKEEAPPGSVTEQAAVKSLNNYPEFRFNPLPDTKLADEVLIQQLRIVDAKGRYTDWRKMVDYAAQVARRKPAEISDQVMQAVIGAMGHEQTHAQAKVAEYLGQIDLPQARAALLAKLVSPDVAQSVRDACLRSVYQQLAKAKGPELAVQRCLVHRTANEIGGSGDFATASGLRRLLQRPELTMGERLLLRGDAAEIVPGLKREAGRHTSAALQILSREEVSSLSEQALGVASEEDLIAAGPPIETKYRFVDLKRVSDVRISAHLAEIGWPLARGFHAAMLREGNRIPAAVRENLLEGIFRGTPCLPGLAGVHAVLITADDRVVFQRRSKSARYAPLHWSASFEEQITARDFGHGPDASVAAVQRGFAEEFHSAVNDSVDSVDILGLLVELGILNIVIVSAVRLKLTYAEVYKNWSEGKLLRPGTTPQVVQEVQLEDDATALGSVELDRLLSNSQGVEVARFSPLHPTSEMRVAMLRRWLSGYAEESYELSA